MGALSIIQLAQNLLRAGQVTKAEPGTEDPDAIQGNDVRTEGGAPTPEAVNAARQEAQSGQQPEGAPGEGGEEGGAGGSSPEPDGDEGEDGPGDNDGDEGQGVAKADVLASIHFLARMHKIAPEEVTKSFSGLEGNPTQGEAPVGHGVEFLEKLVQGQESQNKVLDAIATFLSELAKNQTHLSKEIGKSFEAAEAAAKLATESKEALTGLMRVAPAAMPKAFMQHEVSKALHGGSDSAPTLTSDDLFKAALTGKMSPTEVAAANRSINYRA